MPVDHYENFPVASILLPARLRPAVESIYRFARGADDIADEGDAAPEERLKALADYEAMLDRIEAGEKPASAPFNELFDVIRRHGLPLQPFRDLLSAFRQDVRVTRYARFADLADYCRRSANPVGTLMLHLYGAADADNLNDSDAICTALQLINFWQDVALDWNKGRIYLPQEDMAHFRVGENMIAESRTDERWRGLMRFEVERARAMMLSGAPLALRLRGRIGWELRMIVQGGLRILDRIEAVEYDVFHGRPTLGAGDLAHMTWRALRMNASKMRAYGAHGS